MSGGSLKLPTRVSEAANGAESQLSPQMEKPLSIERSTNDVLLADIVRAALTNFKPQPTPILIPQDRSESTCNLGETLLEGKSISCFNVGGERRLCVPQLLNLVLTDYSIDEINHVFKQLNIHYQQCSREQLNVLKVTGKLPLSADSCTLMKKTDAERLCNALMCRSVAPISLTNTEQQRLAHTSLPVEHRCFGGAKGILWPHLYDTPDAHCIQCAYCTQLFAVDRFVLHTHRQGAEKRTCHWGFDSANWRFYLQLPKRLVADQIALAKLAQIKQRFNPSSACTFVNSAAGLQSLLKRTAEQAALSKPLGEPLDKRVAASPYLLYDTNTLLAYSRLLQESTKKEATPPAVKEAVSGLLALSSHSVPLIRAPIPVKAAEPFKKHLLHQFEAEERRKSESQCPVTTQKSESPLIDVVDNDSPTPDSESTTTASEVDDYSSIDALLSRHVHDTTALGQIRARIADSQRQLEIKVDQLQQRNNILQQQVDLLSGKKGSKLDSHILVGH